MLFCNTPADSEVRSQESEGREKTEAAVFPVAAHQAPGGIGAANPLQGSGRTNG
jgi:hypothetical protein